ncbi:MAG: D-cysteine desulfhydrase [Planctomycetaceae bacterium]|nr:D-cysteine desulfhydrase [Planctomycetaceae bacterium]
MKLADFPRLEIAHRPTPLEPLRRLSAHLGGPEILVKRDDCTGLAGGGNKARKLEYLLADAQAVGATTIITSGGVQSNHARQTAAAAARLGLRCELVLPEIVAISGDSYAANGNVLLDRLLGARLHIVADSAAARQKISEIAAGVAAAGGLPYVIPVGGSNALGALGYVAAVGELFEQLAAGQAAVDAIIVVNGSGGTHAGIVAGLIAHGSSIPVYGISVAHAAAVQTATTVRLVRESAELLGIACAELENRVVVLDQFIGPGYGLPTPEMRAALALVARIEGLLLDPVYTGKGMAGLIELVQRREFRAGQRVLFWHTGGTPGLFAYEPQLTPTIPPLS